MNPLDALSALTSSTATMPGMGTMPTAPTAPSLPGAPVSEGFSLQPMQATGAAAPVSAASAPSLPVSGGEGPTTWGHMVQQMVMDVNSKQQSAAQKVSDVLQGGPTPVHEAMIATEEASLSFEFASEMRNKIVEAYQQVMQMQV
jgi:flagellar hook-basal body complex protein FliE